MPSALKGALRKPHGRRSVIYGLRTETFFDRCTLEKTEKFPRAVAPFSAGSLAS